VPGELGERPEISTGAPVNLPRVAALYHPDATNQRSSFFMNTHMRSLVLIPAFLGLFAGVALADDGAGKTGPAPNRQQWCADNPQKCQEMKSRMQEKCAQDPKRCEEHKARHAEHKAWCEANPEACQKKRAEMRAHRQACREKPESCQHRGRDNAPETKPRN